MIKLLFTALVVFIALYGVRFLARLGRLPGGQARRVVKEMKKSATKSATGGAEPPPKPGAEDMAPCGVCGTYVPSMGARSCGRGDCPYP